MTVAALRLPQELIHALKMRAHEISVVRNRTVSWAELAREMFERELACTSEPTIVQTNA